MRSVTCALVVMGVLSIAGAQRATSVASRVSDILNRMKSTDLPTREAAFSDMNSLVSRDQLQGSVKSERGIRGFLVRHPEQADSVKLGLIHLLSSENDLFVRSKNPGPLTEEDGEYYAEVIDVVSSLDDERAIPALVGAMTTGGMAQRALLRYGTKSLGSVLEQLTNPDPLVRSVAVSTGIHILRKGTDPSSRKQIDDIVKLSLKDPDLVVRGSAVQEIDCLGDREEFVPTLEQLAKNDPAKLPGKALDGGDGGEFYPVRYDARRILRDIQDDKHCMP